MKLFFMNPAIINKWSFSCVAHCNALLRAGHCLQV